MKIEGVSSAECEWGRSHQGRWGLWVTEAVPFIFLCCSLAPLHHQEMRGPEFYLCPSVRLFVNCRSISKIMYKIQTGQLLVSCREWALKEISWLPDLLNEVWVLVSILLGNDMWIEYLYKQAFISVNGWKLIKKKKKKRGLFILAYQDSFLWNKGRNKSFWILWWSPSWNSISSLLLPRVVGLPRQHDSSPTTL